jgi:hypothetical protein
VTCEGDVRIVHQRLQYFGGIRRLFAFWTEKYEVIEHLLLTHALDLVPLKEDGVDLEKLRYKAREIHLILDNCE